MDIGIMVYSQTGNTLSVAEKLKEALSEKGHTVTVDRVTAQGEVAPGRSVSLEQMPDA